MNNKSIACSRLYISAQRSRFSRQSQYKPKNLQRCLQTLASPSAASSKKSSEEHKNQQHRTLRPRLNKPSLPLSPFFDPKAQESRFRWRKPKPRKSDEPLSEFQKKFRRNAYSHILASPVRSCARTQHHLPTDLLLNFHIIPHPDTGHATFMPAQLIRSVEPEPPPLPHGPCLHVCLNRTFLSVLPADRKPLSSVVMGAWLRKAQIRGANNPQWRQDTAEFVHALLRRQLVRKLRGVVLLWEDGLVEARRPGVDDLNAVDDVACVVYLRPIFQEARLVQRLLNVRLAMANVYTNIVKSWYSAKGTSFTKKTSFTMPNPGNIIKFRAYLDRLVPTLQPKHLNPPQEFSTVSWRGQRVPVYDLVQLIGGKEAAQSVLRDTRFSDAECLVLSHSEKTVGAQKAMLRLEAFLAMQDPADTQKDSAMLEKKENLES